jgi:PKD repeat protein
LILVALSIFTLAAGGAGNPILKTFGVPEDGVKTFLLKLVNFSFAGFAVILLLCFAFGLFAGLSATEKSKKSGRLIFSGVSVALLFFSILIWLGMWRFVNAFVVEVSPADAQIFIDVPDAENITAPLDATFSAEKIQKVIENRGFKVAGFRWDFGAGFQDLSRENKITHHFATIGNFLIRLEVVSESGDSQIFTRELKIPKAVFAAIPNSGDAPLRVQFDAGLISENFDAVTFDWDFNDGARESSGAPTISHVFEKMGNYAVKLRILNSAGNVKTFEREIAVTGESARKTTATISAVPENGSAPLKIKFTAKDSPFANGKAVDFEWEFSDTGEKISGESVDYIFKNPGEFTVKLKITDEFEAVRNATRKITIGNPANLNPQISTEPIAKNGKLTGEAPFEVEFSAADSTGKITKFSWDFDGDGKFDSAGSKTNFTFRDAGEFETILKVENSAGKIAKSSISIEVSKTEVGAKITTDAESGIAPFVARFDASKSWCDAPDCKINSFEWDFGDDGEPQLGGAQISHQFSRVGVFDVKLKIFTSNGRTAKDSLKIYAREIPLVACFSPSRETGTAPLTVDFDPSCSGGTIENWKWDFGDGMISTARKTTHTFSDPGEFEITLQVFDAKNNVAEITKKVTVK